MANLKLKAQLKGDHARGAVTAEADAQQAGRRRGRVGEGAETCLRSGISRNAGEYHARKPEIRMVEHIEELDVEAQLPLLGQRKQFRDVEIAPRKIGTAQSVAAEISKLAIRGTVAAEACASARINRRDKSVGVEPLNGARLRDARNPDGVCRAARRKRRRRIAGRCR